MHRWCTRHRIMHWLRRLSWSWRSWRVWLKWRRRWVRMRCSRVAVHEIVPLYNGTSLRGSRRLKSEFQMVASRADARGDRTPCRFTTRCSLLSCIARASQRRARSRNSMVSKTLSRSIASFSQLLDNSTSITYKCFAFAAAANSAQCAAFSRHPLGSPCMECPSYYMGARRSVHTTSWRRSHAISLLQRH